MMGNRILQGKNAIITGARSGIGLATLQLFAKNGCNCWATIHHNDDDFLNKIPFTSDSSIANQKIVIFDDQPKNKYYTGADTATINSYLFTDTGSASVTTYTLGQGESVVAMPFKLNTFNSECVRIILYRSGHMRIQIAGNDKNVYNVGENIYSNVRTYIETLTEVDG